MTNLAYDFYLFFKWKEPMNIKYRDILQKIIIIIIFT